MKITAWRVVKAKYVASAFDGEGARRLGGRWNSRGVSVVYAASSQALAILEMLVHLEDSELLKHYRLIPATFDAELVEILSPKRPPRNWNRRRTLASTRAIGDDWTLSARNAVLQVPSIIVPRESNYLLNVLHPDFRKVQIGVPQPYRFDPRLI